MREQLSLGNQAGAGRKGRVFVVSGPSGVGKGTLCRLLIERLGDMHLSISATTRKIRPSEVHGKDYFFYSKAEFEAMAQQGEMLEWAEYNENYYGTPKPYVDSLLAAGKDVLLEIETEGALSVQKSFGSQACMIFLMPPSMPLLRERLTARGTNTPEDIENRLKIAEREVQVTSSFDHVVTNDDLECCYERLAALVKDERH